MDLSKLVSVQGSEINIKAKNSEDLLKKIGELAVKDSKCSDIDKNFITEKLSERESQGSTGVGDGVAIPHARIKGMKEFMIMILTSKGVDYGAFDNKKIKLFFVILGPEEDVNQHLQILAALAGSINKIKRELLAVRKKDALIEIFQRGTLDESKEEKESVKKKLMIVTLYIEEYLYPILELFIQEDIDGASIIESAGMGQYISNIPLFATFIGFMNADKNSSKTIMAMIPENKVDKIIKRIEGITGDLDKKEGAMIICLDVSYYKGTMKIL